MWGAGSPGRGRCAHGGVRRVGCVGEPETVRLEHVSKGISVHDDLKDVQVALDYSHRRVCPPNCN